MPVTQRGGGTHVFAAVATAKAVAHGDLAAVADDGGMYKASEQAWDTDLPTTRAAFVSKFFGAASQNKKANEDVPVNVGPHAGKVRLASGGTVSYAAAAGTYADGVTLVGPAKQGGNALENQKVEVVGTQAQAVGVVARGGGVNPAAVEVQLLSSRTPAARQ